LGHRHPENTRKKTRAENNLWEAGGEIYTALRPTLDLLNDEEFFDHLTDDAFLEANVLTSSTVSDRGWVSTVERSRPYKFGG
jgi:hypothetical protein